MKFFLLAALVAIATADVAHLKKQNKRQLLDAANSYNAPGNSYGARINSFGVPQGSVQTLSYSGAGNIDHAAQPGAGGSFSASFDSGFGLPNANAAAFQQATFSSTPSPLSAGIQSFEGQQSFGGSSFPDAASLGFSTAAPFDSSSFQSNGFQFSTPAPALSEVSNYQYSAAAPAISNIASYQVSNPSVSRFSGFGQADFGGLNLNGGIDAPAYSGPGGIDASVYSGAGGIDTSAYNGAVESQQSNGPAQSGESHSSGQVNTVETQTTGGSLNEAFGVPSSTPSSAYSDAVEVGNGPAVEPKVVKNVYFYESPEDEELVVSPKINYEQQQPTKSYKIIFVKAPSYKANLPIEIPAPPAHEEKTLVYVLVKKPEANAVVNVRAGQPPVQTKPEVFFIKYKTQQEAEEAVAKIQAQQGIQNAQNGFGAGSSRTSSLDASVVLSSRTLPEGSSIAGAGVMSEADANSLSAAGHAVAEVPEAVVSSQGLDDSQADAQVSNEAVVSTQAPAISSDVVSSLVGGSGQVDAQVSHVATGSDVYTLSPVTAGPQSFLTGTYNEHQVGLLGSPAGLLQGKFGLTVSHDGSSGASGASGVSEVSDDVTPATVEISSPSAHTEDPAPEVIMPNDDENNVDASAGASFHEGAGAHADANVEVGFQSYGPPAKRSILMFLTTSRKFIFL